MMLFPILVILTILAFMCLHEYKATSSKSGGFVSAGLMAVVLLGFFDTGIPLAREAHHLSRVADAIGRLNELKPEWHDSLRLQLGLAPNGELCNPGQAVLAHYDDDFSRFLTESKTEAYAQAKTYCDAVRLLTEALEDTTRSTLYPVARYLLLPAERNWIEVSSKNLGFRR